MSDTNLLIQPPGVIAERDAIEEMHAVLDLHERHAIVIPRSNSGSMARVPLTGPELEFEDAFETWRRLRDRLPRHQVVPWAEPTCMLVRNEAVRRFGPPGEDVRAYSERINRYGYSTVLANHAFVRNPGCKPSDRVEPEYLAMEADPADYFCALEQPHRRRVLFDLTHVRPEYNGTAVFALNLLRDVRVCSRDEFDITLDIQPETFRFFLPELHGYSLHEPGQQYDLAFKPTQISSWRELQHLNLLAPRIAYTMLDVIGVRCNYLGTPGKRWLFKHCAELCEGVFTLSHSAAADFKFLTGSETELKVVHLATHYGVSAFENMPGKYILVIGNSYAHKAVAETLEILAPQELPIVVVGGNGTSASAHVHYLSSGSVTPEAMREVLAASRILVYPSHYEGFGLPIADGLALGKPVLALDTGTNRELAAALGDPNLYLVPSLDALPEAVHRLWLDPGHHEPAPPRRWYEVAQEYIDHFQTLLRRNVDVERVRRRCIVLRSAFV